MSLLACARRSTTTGRRLAASDPDTVKSGWPSSTRTISIRVVRNAPPETRKLAYGCVTGNCAEVSTPRFALPPGRLLTQYSPARSSGASRSSGERPAALTIENASPVAVQSESEPVSKSRLSDRCPTAGAVPSSDVVRGSSETSSRPSIPEIRWPGSEQ